MLAQSQAAMRLADTDPGRAVTAAATAARRARRGHHAEAAAIAERAWGQALLSTGQMDRAIHHLRRSIAHGTDAGSAELAGEARLKLAFALVQRGRPHPALREINTALLDLTGVGRARAQAQRAVILYQAGRLNEAAADYESALRTLRPAGDLLAIQRILINRGILRGELHDFDAAIADLTEAEGLARALGRQAALGIITENLGFIETQRGDVPAALAYLARSERIIGEHGVQLGPSLQDRAALLLSVGLVAEAQEVAERAVDAFQRERRHLKVPEMRLLLAQAAALAQQWCAALDQARRAARGFGRQHRPEWAALARLAALRARFALGDGSRISARQVDQTVQTLDRCGWPAATLEARLLAAQLAGVGRSAAPHRPARQRRRHQLGLAALRAASRARRSGPVALRARGWYAQALLRLDEGDTTAAVAAARRGLRLLDEHNAAMAAADLRAHSAIHRAELVRLGLRLALGSGRPAAVFEWAERGRASHLLHRAVRPPEDQELARLLRQLRAVATEVDRDRDTARWVHRQVELERQIRDHCRLRRAEAGGPLAAPVRPAALHPALGDWALLEFVQLDGVLHGLSLAGGRLRLRTVGEVAGLAELVERLPFALHRIAARGGRAESKAAALALLRQAAARLDNILLAPFAAELGDRPLVVVPTEPLHGVPWSTLPSCAQRPLAVAPSATLWHTSSTCAGDAPTAVAVAAGPRLLGARAEAEAVAAIHGTTALLDGAATAERVLAALGSAGLVHLAAHGRLAAHNPLFSDLLLADGPLVVYDLEQLPRVPHTVVLAACDSGRSVVRTGDELLGLSAAFIARGAAQLIASVVPIPDAQTEPLMIAFHQRLAHGEPPAVALATARQQLTADDTAAIAAAAGFVCLGAGRPTTRPSP